jgi:ATP-dependent Clp protease adaptor protein ClpS
MVPRNEARAKREHALFFTFKSVGEPLIAGKRGATAGFPAGREAVKSPQRLATSGGAAGMIDTVAKPRTKVKTKTERPKLHKVILVNDDYTPREFVVSVLKAEFRMTAEQAHKVMITAHRRGVCVVAVFTKDIAETKATRATDAGRAKGYPLLFTTEPEE